MKHLIKTMAFTLLGLVLSMNLMAENAKVDDILWKESFSGGSSSTTFSETSSWTTGDGTTMLVAADKNKISYSASDGMLSTASSGGIDGSHCWLKKNTTGYFQVNNIPIYNAKKLVASLIKNSKTVITFSYKFDTETSWNNSGTTGNASNTSGSSSEITVPTNAQTISLKFTRNSSNDASRIDDLTLTVTAIATAEGETSVAISPEGGEFVDSKEITLTPTPADAAVYYTTNGDEPTASSTSYLDPFTITESCTIKAIAVKQGSTKQNVASAEFKKITPLSTMGDIFNASAIAGDYYITFDNWVISGVKNSNAYLTDKNGKGLIIYKSGHGFVAGDILSGTVQCALTRFNGSAEITNLTSSSEGLSVTTGGTVTAIPTTIDALSGVNTGALISLGTLTYNGSDVFSDGTNTIKAYNSIMTTLPSWTSGLKYTVQGVYIQYNSDKEIAPRDANDIVEKQADKFAITIANGIQNGSVSVQGGKTQAAEDEQVVLIIEPANNYKLATLIVDDSDVTASVSDNKYTFSMLGHAVNVSATFAAKEQYTITWNDRGNTDTKTSVLEGDGLVLPAEPTAPTGWAFVGWTLSEGYSNATIAPTFAKNGDAVSGPATYYAVFAVANKVADGATETLNVGAYATAHNWVNSNPYKSAETENVSYTAAGTGNNCKYYSSDQSWRFYDSGNGSLTIATTNNAIIKSIAITGTNYMVAPDNWSNNNNDTYTPNENVEVTTVTLASGSGTSKLETFAVTFGDAYDYSNYTTNPTEQVKISFDLNGGTGTFNDVSIDKGFDYTVTFDKPIPATGYEFVDWTNGDNHYVGGNTIKNVTSNITLTAQYKKAWYEVSKATMENGTINISADPALNENTAEYGATVTLTPAPNTNYAFESIDAYKAGKETTKVTLTPDGDNYTFTMPAYAVEVSATFIAAASSCNIYFYAAGNTTTPMKTISKKRGEKYEITEVGTAVDGFTFVGWATATQDAEVETPITTVSSVTPEIGSEEDINLYAVYKRAAVEAAYEKVTAEPTSWEGQYLFVYDDKVAMDGGLETLDAVSNTILVEVEDNKIISKATTDAASFTIAAVTDGYSVKSASGKYIYPASFKNGLAYTETWKASDCTLQISFSDGINKYFQGATQDKTGTMNLRYNKSEGQTRFRFFTNNSQQAISYFKLGKASYVYTTSPVVKYTISYDLNGGSKGEGNFDEQQVVKGTNAPITASIPTKKGCTFVNWKDADGNTYSFGATISNVQKDIKLVAQYNVNRYVVTHTATNGAINVATLDAESKAEYGATLTISLEPESGYEIDPTVELKAYKTGDESIPVSITDNTITMPDCEITIVAGFRAETPEYTIKVQSANTEQGTVSIFEETETTLSLKEGDERTILAWPNEGYRFVNWKTEDDITITGADEDEATFTVKTSDATITANFEAIPSVTYTKITTTDDLAYNDKVIIVAATANMAMSATQNTNNRSYVAITRGNEGATITLATDEVAVLDVLSGNAAQTFAFHDANGYLYAASSSNNYMKSEKKLDANGNGNWNVTISEGSATIVAQGTNTHKLMQYNPNNGNGLFTCYTSPSGNYQYVSLYRIKSADQVLVTLMNGEEVFARYRANKNSSITLNGFAPTIEGKTIAGWTDGATIYELDAEVTVAEANITLNIAFEPDFTLANKAAGAFATICLPRKIDHVENATLWSINYGNTSAIEFVEADLANDAAGMPYLVQVAENGNVNFYYTEDGDPVVNPVSPKNAKGFVGKLVDDDPENPTPVPSDGSAILISGGQLHIAGEYCVLTKNHAYITTEYLPTEPALVPGAPRRTMTLYNPDAQAPTNLNGLKGNMKAVKVLREGQFYILREAKTYNAQGIEVQ